MKKILAGIAVAFTLAGCDSLKPPEVGQSADQAYGTATAHGSVEGSASTDVQSLQNNRANDAEVINAAQKALGQR